MTKILIGKYKGSIYPEGDGFTGAISLGFGPDGRRKRPKRKGKTEAEVQEKLTELVRDLEAGVKSPEKYTVRDAVEDFLTKGLKGKADSTVTNLRTLAETHIIPGIGRRRLKKLTADEVDDWLETLTDVLASSTLSKVHGILKRAIRQAQARDKVIRNVAELVTTPKGKEGRPSKALTFEQATKVLQAALTSVLYAYVVLSLSTGIRTEEARALLWHHVVAWTGGKWQPVTKVGWDHERFAFYVWRSVRKTGDTKTEKSRRTLELPRVAVDALRAHHEKQKIQSANAGKAWTDHRLVFCTRTGGPVDAGNVRRGFKAITRRAGIGEDWTPQELRHSFVSIMSDHGLPIEAIADLVGHANPTVTGKVYRKQLKPVITAGAEVINDVFSLDASEGDG